MTHGLGDLGDDYVVVDDSFCDINGSNRVFKDWVAGTKEMFQVVLVEDPGPLFC